GFGVVYRAHDELLRREVALKRIPRSPGGARDRANREALAAARLSHPAIVALYEACATDDAFFLITELVRGQTLARLIADGALTRTGDVIGALAYMAPEQADGRDAEEAADLYSLTLVLYEALSGTNPVRGTTPAQTARRIGNRVPSLAQERRDLSRELIEALDCALLARPRARGTLAELGEALAGARRSAATELVDAGGGE